jgi:peptidyl-prolyl cis-trans isomerase SurA
MRKAVFLLAVFCLSAVALAFAGSTVIEEIIARVNNAIVTRSDYQRARTQALQECKQQVPAPPADAECAKREKDTLRDLIDQQLLIQKGKDLNVNVDTELLKQLDEMRKQMNLPTMEDLEKAAASQGVSWEDFRAARKNELITREVVGREVQSHLTVTNEEMKQFYEEHKKEMDRPESVDLSEILVSTEAKQVKDESGQQRRVDRTPEEIAAAEAKAHQLLDEIKKGAKFEDVARRDSNGPTAADGGELGEFERGKLAKELEDLTFNMKPGAVSDVIRTKQGFVILKVNAHYAAGIPPFNTVQEQVQNAILYQKLQPALRTYLTKLREQAFIDIKPGYTDTAASPNETKPVYTTTAEAGAKKLKKKKKFLIF